MSREYLNDMNFLKALDEMRIKEHFIRIQIMNFQEKPIREIQGIATAGSISVNGASAVRRTINLTLTAAANENDISNIDNIISANKKVAVEVGIRNPFLEYKKYGDIIWFKQGVYVITEASTSTSATNATITIKGKDKMCMLDGTCGGVLPATVSFHELEYEDSFGDVVIEKVPIFTIIKECVHHYGQEIEQNIIINDVDLIAKQSVKYVGMDPIWFTDDYSSFIISKYAPESKNHHAHKFVFDQDIGYMETDFTFPGELVFDAGSTVTEVLDKIIQTIGNYEYFYDLDGHFVFQEKRNYLNNYYTPVTELNDTYYVKAFSDTKYHQSFINAKDSISYMQSPKYDNIKNDFVVWGTKTNSLGVTRSIKYHLAIDEKPYIELANQYMWEVKNGKQEHLYYILDDELKEYNNVPEAKPVELFLMNDSSLSNEGVERELKAFIASEYINKDFYESSYILYVRVYNNDEIRYYQVKVQNYEISSIEYLDYLTDNILSEDLYIGVYIKELEEKEESDGDNYLPDMGDSEIEGSDPKEEFLSRSIKLVEIPKEKRFYVLLQIEKKDNNKDTPYEIGYYDKEKKWVCIKQLKNQQVELKDIDQLLTNIDIHFEKNQGRVRIFVNSNFDKKSFNSQKMTDLNYASGSIITSPVYPNKIKYSYNDKEFLNFNYSFKDFLIEDNKIGMTKKDRETMIKELASLYEKDYETLLNDIETLADWKARAKDDKDFENLLPFDSDDSTIEGSEGKQEWLPGDFQISLGTGTEELNKVKIIPYNIAKLIYYKYFECFDDVKVEAPTKLGYEVEDYYFNNVLELTGNLSKYKIKVITYTPEKIEDFDYGNNFYYKLIGKPCNEWREELYRQALLNQENAGAAGYYDEELLAYWRQNFDTLNSEWEQEWNDYIDDNWQGWNPAIYTDPGLLHFWLDFLDSDQLITTYSVNQIGRRSKVIKKDNINMLYKLEVPDVIFFENKGNAETQLLIQDYINIGQEYCALKKVEMRYFASSSTGSTAFDYIREMLYSNLYYNIAVTINCTPRYYLEPNNIIQINDSRSNINGDFVIAQFTLPLTYNGSMSIQTNEALVRV